MSAVIPLKEHDYPESAWKRLGMLAPSSNTVLEPTTARMVAELDGKATVHVARFPVVEISMAARSQQQFALEPILNAARLLADAKPDIIAWNGTSAAWLGFETDIALCQAISEQTGVPATSAILALNEALDLLGAKRVAFVTPYLSEIQDRLLESYKSAGYTIAEDIRLEDRGNFSFACYSAESVADLIRTAAQSKPDAIAVICTNFRGADLVDSIERETGVMVIDSVAVTLWGALRTCDVATNQIQNWGRLFRELI
ncbi:MAG: aspartate/glutamate racemase family protein [Pseudomonadota bacterium]